MKALKSMISNLKNISCYDIYPNGFTEEIIFYIKDNLTDNTDISFLSAELQKLIRPENSYLKK